MIRYIYRTPYGTSDSDPAVKKVILPFYTTHRINKIVAVKPVVKRGLGCICLF